VGIASEQGKIYRAAASGAIETGEAMRLSCILRELRAALEAANAAATIDVPAGSSGDIIILAVPRGSHVDLATGICTTPAGDPVTMQLCEPFVGTPALELLADQTPSFEPLPPLPVLEEIADDKIAVLHPHRRRDDGPPGVA
jgi:hypothetical protein